MDVILLGFDGHDAEGHVGRLQRVFGLDFATAARVVRSAPATVKRNTPPEVAERYRAALSEMGARVELRPSSAPPGADPRGDAPVARPDGDSWAPPLEPSVTTWELDHDESTPVPAIEIDRVPAAPGIPSEYAARRRALAEAELEGWRAIGLVPGAREPEEEEPAEHARSFWAALPDAAILPFRGPGLRWLGWCAGASLVYAGLMVAVGWLGVLGYLVSFLLSGVLLGLVAGYFRACLWGALSGDDEPDNMPEPDVTGLLDDYLVPGLLLDAFLLLSQIAFLAWLVTSMRQGADLVHLMAHPVGWILLVGPVLYWPVGLGMMALESRTLAFWDFFRGIGIAVRAPLELMAVVAVSLAAWVLPLVAFGTLSITTGLVGAVVLSPVVVGVPLAYSHAVQGAMVGHLFRTRPELGT